AESLERLRTTVAQDVPEADPLLPGALLDRVEEAVEAWAELLITFDVEADLLHHRVPPRAPRSQTLPSLYSPSQWASFSDSRRRRVVVPNSRSQTTTSSGV